MDSKREGLPRLFGNRLEIRLGVAGIREWLLMHELSIVNSLIELVAQRVTSDELPLVRSIHLRVGALSSVHPESLRFSFLLATQGTSLQNAILEIEMVPVSIYCSQCDSIETLPGIQSFCCPRCQTPSAEIRDGQELELHSIELDDALPIANPVGEFEDHATENP